MPKEHILVCLSSSPSNERIVRMAGKMAQAFCASLTALYVQTPGDADMNAEDTVRLQANMRLGQQLGAEIVTTHGEDVATQIAEYVRLSDVTKIVIGRSGVQRRHFWSESTLTEQLITLAPEVDIYIIPDVEAYKNCRRNQPLTIRPAFPTARELLLTIGILAATTVIGWIFLRLSFANDNIIMVYLLGVLLTSTFTSGYTCGVLSAFLSVLLFNYFLTEPRLSLAAYGSKYPITFAVMFAAALLTSTLAAKLKAHAQLSARDAYRTKLLFDMNMQLQKAETPEEVYRMTATQIQKLMQRDVLITRHRATLCWMGTFIRLTEVVHTASQIPIGNRTWFNGSGKTASAPEQRRKTFQRQNGCILPSVPGSRFTVLSGFRWRSKRNLTHLHPAFCSPSSASALWRWITCEMPEKRKKLPFLQRTNSFAPIFCVRFLMISEHH